MSENVRKLIGVAVMAAIVVVGVVATSGDDSDFSRTRNAAFMKLGDIKGEAYVPDGRNDGKVTLDVGPVNKLERDPIFKGSQNFGEFRYQGDSDIKLADAVKFGGQEGEAVNGENYKGLESERRNVVALGADVVASVIVGDNHFRDVGDPASALKKLGENMETLIVDDKSVGGRGPISKVVGNDSPTLAIQTDDGLTLGPLGGEGVFISIQDEALIDVDTSEYTEVEWTYLQKSLLEASENLVAMAKRLEVWTNGNATSVGTDDN